MDAALPLPLLASLGCGFGARVALDDLRPLVGGVTARGCRRHRLRCAWTSCVVSHRLPNLSWRRLRYSSSVSDCRAFAAGLEDRFANFIRHVVGELDAPVRERHADALLAVAGEDEAVAALVGIYAPDSDLRVEELRLQDDDQVLLDLRIGDAEPAKMRLVAVSSNSSSLYLTAM